MVQTWLASILYVPSVWNCLDALKEISLPARNTKHSDTEDKCATYWAITHVKDLDFLLPPMYNSPFMQVQAVKQLLWIICSIFILFLQRNTSCTHSSSDNLGLQESQSGWGFFVPIKGCILQSISTAGNSLFFISLVFMGNFSM